MYKNQPPLSLSRLTGNSWPMMAGYLANSISGFVVFVILLNNLSSTEYGLIVLYSTTVVFIGLVGSGGLQGALEGKFHHYLDLDQMDDFLSTSFATSSIFMIIVVSLTFFLSLLHDPFENSGEFPYFSIIAMACIASIFTSHTSLGTSLLKISEKTFGIAAISILSSIVSVILAYLLLIHLDFGIKGALFTLLITRVLIGISYSIVVFRKISIFSFNSKIAKSIIVFGFPLMLTAATSTITNLGDRFVIESLMGASDVGVYNAGYQFFAVALSLGIVVVNGWTPIFFDGMAKDPSNKRIFSDFASIGSSLGALGFLTFITIFNLFQGSILPDEYPEAPIIFYVVCASCIPLMLHNLNVLRLIRVGRTKTILAISASIAFANIAFNFAAIPFIGVLGAALATSITSLSSPFLSHFAAKTSDQLIFKGKLGIFLNCSVVAVLCAICMYDFSTTSSFVAYLLLCTIPAYLLFMEKDKLVWN